MRLNKNNFFSLIEYFKKKTSFANILLKIQFWIFNNTTFLQKLEEIKLYFAKNQEKVKFQIIIGSYEWLF